MSILNLVLYPDDPLRDVAEPFETIGPEVVQLARDMLETMTAYEGIGLAGPQVGLSQRILVLREPEGPEMCLVNPEILEAYGREEGEEGCLSLPRIYAEVPRAVRIRVRAFDAYGKLHEFEAEQLLARIIQHEIDHLDGIIFLDRLDVLTRQAKLAEWEEIRGRMMAALGEG